MSADYLCFQCLSDTSLEELAKASSARGTCAACGRMENALALADIAAHLDEVITSVYYGSLPAYEELDPGADLRSIVRELLGKEHPCEDAIIEALESRDLKTHGKGTFYSETAVYEKRQAAAG